MRIIIGCDTFSPDVNGAARFAERLAAGLVSRGHEVHVVAPASSRSTAGTGPEVIAGETMIVHRLPSWRWLPHDWLRFVLPWTIRRRSAQIIDEVKPDVIHIQSYIIIGRGLAIEGHARGIRIVGTNHLMPENALDFTVLPATWMTAFVRWQWGVARHIFGLCSAVTTPTRRAADFLEKYSGLRGVIPISCGIDTTNYVADLTPRATRRVIFVGRLTTEKQVDVLLRAYAKLDPRLADGLDIVGGGDQAKHFADIAAELRLGYRVTFHGLVSEQRLRDLYTAAAVFVMPSIAELQSISTMEAMASGLPVVAADAMALPHLVTNGKNGYLFAPGNVDDLAEKLTRVLTATQDEYSAMQHASIEALKPHDINRTLETFERLYRGEPVDIPSA